MEPLGVGVPIALAFAVCLALGEECGSIPTFFFIVTFAFPFGWLFSGIVCWVLGRIWNEKQSTHTFLGLPLEYWGLIYFMAGLGLTLFCYVVVYKTLIQ